MRMMTILGEPPKATHSDNGNLAPHPDLEWREVVKGTKPGDRFIRIGTHQGFKRIRPGYVVPQPDADEARGPVGRVMHGVKRTLIGRPIPTVLEAHERLTK